MRSGSVRKLLLPAGDKDCLKGKIVRFSLWLSAITVVLAMLVLVGWILDVGYFKSFFPNADPMTANAAILFILSGLAIFFSILEKQKSKCRVVILLICSIVIAVAVLTTLEYAFSINIGIDELLFKEEISTPGTFPPGRMTLLAAINFILIGSSTLLVYYRKWMTLSQSLTVVGILLGGLSLIGYLYGVDSLYDVSSYTQMTFSTTIACIILNFSLLLSRPNDGLMKILTSNTLGGVMARRLLPMAVAVPLIIGWFRLVAEIIGLFSINIGVSLMVFTTIISLTVIIWLNALFLHRLDISRKRLERDIVKAMHTAESATRAKSEFLANMSHEIRTPINGITGMISLTLDSEISPASREYLLHANSSAQTLTRIIDDILDFSKIEAGKLKLEQVDFNLDAIFEEMKVLFSNDATDKGVKLVAAIHHDVERNLAGDPVRLKQVLMNLLRNAIKFTSKGSITLKAEPGPAGSGAGITIMFSVADTGIGIAKNKTDQIFEAFSQVDGSTTRLYGGTGLGLTISKSLVKMMGGQIWVTSSPGKGSTFFFTAIFRQGEHSAARQEERKGAIEASGIPTGLTVYLADDNEVNRILMNNLLAKIGATVTTVDNGIDMLAAFKREVPDIILMDIQMPGMDGVETTKRIRELEKNTATHTPIIAVTGHALRGDRERFLAAGMDGYIPEPIDIGAFFDLVRAFTSDMSPREPSETQAKTSLEEWVNMDDFKARVNNDTDLIRQLLKMYLEESREHLARIERAIRDNAPAELERSAHSLKGVSANLSAYKVSELASRLEDLGESGSIAGADAVLTDLGEALNKTIHYMENYLNERVKE